MLAHEYPAETQQLYFQEHRDFSAQIAKEYAWNIICKNPV
jgi:hypothetical protein